MKSDITRQTYNPQAHRRTVRFQQGRVPLDAELNESQDLLISRTEIGDGDIIGPAGGPVIGGGFDITVNGDGNLVASLGRYYVQGILCSLEQETLLTAQPDLPGYSLPTEAGTYLAVLDVSFDHLTAREDPSIQEVALHGAETTTRQRIKTQIRLVQVSETPHAPVTCTDPFDAWTDLVTPPTGAAAARAEPEETAANECSITPGAGYRNLYNQLYRLEIHQAGDHTSATYKWSRENGCIVSHWISQDGDDLTVEPQSRDPYRLFQPGGWIELIDRERELREEPGTLVQLLNVRDNVLTLDPATATGPVDFASFHTLPRIRRWEGGGAHPLNHNPNADGFTPLEFGVQCRFADGTYHTGDYWLIPARTATGDVEWPLDETTSEPALLPRQGVHHHYARLALLSFDGQSWTVLHDCRLLFPPLTEPRDCDLKLHNRHLHGMGVVCGLQVRCGGDDAVQVLPGHALDCHGADLLLEQPTTVPVVAPAAEQGLLDEAGNGDVLLTLQAAPDGSPTFALRPAPDEPDNLQGILQHILTGTLWWDFYHDCLQPLVEFLREQLIEDDASAGDTLVSPQKARLLTLANLLAHHRQHLPSRRLWLSRQQHDLLQALYEELIQFASSSKALCGSAGEFPPFPPYPFENRPIRTAFAGHRLQGLKTSPDGRRACAWSTEQPGRFFVLNAHTAVFESAVELTNAAGTTVRDVSFVTLEGSLQIIVLATLGNTSEIHLIRASDLKPAQPPIRLSGGLLSRLEMHPLKASILIAVEPGQGVHFLNLNQLDSGPLPDPEWAFPATGSLAIAENAIAATATLQTGLPNGTYDAVFTGLLQRRAKDQLNREPLPIRQLHTGFTSGSDGLALARSGERTFLHLIVDPPSGSSPKSVLIADIASRQLAGTRTLPLADDDTSTTGRVHLHAVPAANRIVFALEQRNQLLWSTTAPGNQPINATLPAQSQPVALTISRDQILVAHAEGMTATAVPLSEFTAPGITDAQLHAYRASVLNAFQSLLIPLLQRLKDCLCDKLLVDCPTCGEEEFLVLSRIQIRNRTVHHLCNRARREVLTFPKVAYWLSAVPILPLLDFLIGKFCCWILPALPAPGATNANSFAAANASTTPAAGSLALEAVIAATQSDQPAAWLRASSNQFSRVQAFSRLSTQKAIQQLRQPNPQSTPSNGASEVLRQPSEKVVTDLSAAGIQVERVSDYQSLLGRDASLPRLSTVPANLKPGDRVELFTQGNQVLYYRRIDSSPSMTPSNNPSPSADTTVPGTAPAETNAFLQQVRDLQSEVSLLKTRNQALLTESRAELARSQEAVANLRQEHTEQLLKFSRTLQELSANSTRDRETLGRLESVVLRRSPNPSSTPTSTPENPPPDAPTASTKRSPRGKPKKKSTE